VQISNAVSLAGHVEIESQARISGVLGVHQFVRIGRLSMIAGMSRIERDVPPFMLVEGSPARVRALNKVGLQRAGFEDSDALATLKQAFRILYRSGLTLAEATEQLGQLSANEALSHLHQFIVESQKEGRRSLTPGLRVSPSKNMDGEI
jgi:UDP-N-acetylglucosamine acyltransferase